MELTDGRSGEAIKPDVHWRAGPIQRQSPAQISQELWIHVITVYKWREALHIVKVSLLRAARAAHQCGLRGPFPIDFSCGMSL